MTHDYWGFAQALFPVSLEDDGRNIRVINIITPPPRLQRSGEFPFFCPHFSDIAFFLKMSKLHPLSGSHFFLITTGPKRIEILFLSEFITD
jgi:hypothetical protein